MALADIYEVVQAATFLGEKVLNVFHCLRAGPSFDAGNVAQAFADSTITEHRNFTHNTMVFNSVQATSLGDPTDFSIKDLLGVTGIGVGEAMPCHDTFKVQFLRKRTDMRHGWKRLAGMEEGAQNGGTITGATLTSLNIWATAVLANWEESAAPGINVANFVVVKRIRYVDPIDGRVKYRLPATDAELVTYQPTQAVTGTVSTQNTRKR